MIDRNVEFPNRFRMTLVPGTDDIYEVVPAPGDVVAEGDTFSKVNMLPDSIPALLGLKMANPQVKDALNVLANIGNVHVWERVQDGVTDYLTSTDRNAYPDQSAEGGKDAYYSLGDVQSLSIPLDSTNIAYTSSLSVSDNGSISTFGWTNGAFSISGSSVTSPDLTGKYVTFSYNTQGYPEIWYIPSDSVASSVSRYVIYTKAQKVTGYPAIPANTVITYLGQLGAGARIEVGSYVGTGTYGSSNPNSLTFDFVPKIVVIQISTESSKYGSCIALNGSKQVVTYPSTDYASEFLWNKKTVSWYNQDGSDFQLNKSNAKYNALAIG